MTGICDTAPMLCDDGIGCTIDSCTNGICENLATNAVCDLADPCSTYVCDVALGRCVTNNITCPDDGLFCTTAVCVAFEGCNNQSLSCNSTVSDSTDCGTTECVEEQKQCVKEARTCPTTIVVTAVALTAGVIAGIVVGIVAFLACASGASYAAYNQLNLGGVNAVTNNPLYRSQGTAGTNPIYQEQ
jgi:hypothetical protein